MIIYVDIDNTICETIGNDYENAIPIHDNIIKINKLFQEGHYIVYWTARGGNSGKNWEELTRKQLADWNCQFNKLDCKTKPSYDLLICDKTKRIEEV